MTINVCDTCGSAFRSRGDTCPDCGCLLPEKGEIRRLPHEVVNQFLEHAEEFLSSGPLRQAVLAFTAGSFITFGAVLSVALTVGVESEGLSRLLLGLGFSAGFILVILSGSALFTEINVLLPEMFLSRPRDLCRRCWRFWLITYGGNVAGALFVGSLINAGHVLGPLREERLFEILRRKSSSSISASKGGSSSCRPVC